MNQDALRILAKELTGEQFKVLMLMLADLDYENFIQIAQADIAETLGMQKTNVSRAVRATGCWGDLWGPKVGRSKTYRLNEQFGWKGTVTNHKRHSKTALVSFRAAGFKEPAAGGQSTEHLHAISSGLSILHCSFAASKSLACFCSPISRTTEPPRFRQRLERNRKPSEPQTPIAVTPTVYDHLPTSGCLYRANGLCRGWRGSWRPESPWLGYRRA